MSLPFNAFAQKIITEITVLDDILEINLILSDKLSSQEKNYRLAIRNKIIELHASEFSSEDIFNLQNLSAPPRLNKKFVSISHCQSLGGFVTSSQPVGFDIEEITRIKPEVIQRISQDVEIKSAPQLFYLWPAKEAAFKALSLHRKSNSQEKPTVASDVRIQNWKEIKSNFGIFYSFDGTHSENLSLKQGHGYIFHDSTHISSIFFVDLT